MILKKDEFSLYIENRRAATKESYIDSILAACERFKVEVDLVQPLLTDQLIMKLKSEAIDLHIIKTDSTSLKSFL